MVNGFDTNVGVAGGGQQFNVVGLHDKTRKWGRRGYTAGQRVA
jgi:hypothetical protein